MKDDAFLLVKFGSESDMFDLFNNGTIYCKTLNWFKLLEDGKVRGDNQEGLSYLLNLKKEQIKETTLTISPPSNKSVVIHPTALHLKGWHNPEHRNAYCMYAVPERDQRTFTGGFQLRFNPGVLKFGSYAVVFNDSKEFYNRITMALRTLSLEYQSNHIQYINMKEYSGHLTFFHKSDEYAWQQEFRFLIQNNVDAVLSFNIGPVKDIATIHNVESAIFNVR